MTSCIQRSLTFVLFLTSLIGVAHGATINASSCAKSAVQSAINAAKAGDTVAVPAGNCSWGGTLSLPNNKRITLQGAGKDATIITGEVFFGSSGSRVTAFTFKGNPIIVSYGYGFRLDHCKIQRSNWSDAVKVWDHASSVSQTPYGLVDNNEFINSRVNMEGSPYMFSEGGIPQHQLWALPLDLGGPSTVYVEDNTFELTYGGNFNAIDANYGGSFVARYNVLYDGLFIETHSSQEGGNRSGKSFEVYGNVIDLRNDLSATGGYSYRMRGGTGVIFGNRHLGNWPSKNIPLDNVRSYAAGGNGGRCDGSSAWDGNNNSTGWPCRDQIGRGPDGAQWNHNSVPAYAQPSVPAYFWNNKDSGTKEWPPMVIAWSSDHIKADRDYYAYSASFNGASGVGCGTVAARPASCTVGVGYWATNQSCSNLSGRVGVNPTTPIAGTLFKCTAPNKWTAYYTPYAYPHPSRQGDSGQGGGSSGNLLPATNLRIVQ